MYSDWIDTWSRDNAKRARRCRARKQEDEAMEYLKDLIERLGKALRIKSPAQARRGSASTNQLGPGQGPVRDPR
jgi:hypothetical protein